MKNVLITGAAGFIGYHVVNQLLKTNKYMVVGIDALNDYYDPSLKTSRLEKLGISDFKRTRFEKTDHFHFYYLDLQNSDIVNQIFSDYKFDFVIHLAAQAGVRYSISHPSRYIESNILGFFNILQAAKDNSVEHFVYASSSSVYGLNEKMPLAVTDNVDHPISLYAATKKSNELMAHTYSHLFHLPTTGLRFFTVYGPWGRPDMAYFKFTQSILGGETIDVYNHGDMHRDFTYIDDIVDGILKVMNIPPASNTNWDPLHPDPSTSLAPYRVCNIGNHQPVKLINFIHILEKHLGEKAKINFMPMQPGDVYKTFADVSQLQSLTDYSPDTTFEEGIENFVRWYRDFYSC